MWMSDKVTRANIDEMVEQALDGIIVADAPVSQDVLNALTELVFAPQRSQALIDNVYKAFENPSAGVDGVLFKEFNEDLHPRDERGRFSSNDSGTVKIVASNIAKKVASRAREIEPKLTADMEEIASAHGGHLHGLEFKVKGEDSLERKILDDAQKEYGGNLQKAANALSDVNRYTVLFPHDRYADSVQNALADLRERGYNVDNTKNYWGDNNPYKGINVAMVHPDGDKVELQFHTPESSLVKAQNHPLYSKYRVMADKSSPEAQAVYGQMVANSDALQHPAGVDSVGVRKETGRKLVWA